MNGKKVIIIIASVFIVTGLIIGSIGLIGKINEEGASLKEIVYMSGTQETTTANAAKTPEATTANTAKTPEATTANTAKTPEATTANTAKTQGTNTAKTYKTSANISDIKIDDDNADVKIIKADGNSIVVTYIEKENFVYEISEEGSSLVIKHVNLKSGIDYILNFENESRTLTVAVPAKFTGNISADTGNGNITLDLPNTQTISSATLETGNHDVIVKNVSVSGMLSAKTSSGNIDFKSCKSNGITAETSNGAVLLTSVSAKGNIDCKTNNGKINVSNTTCANIFSKTSNGEITVSSVNASGTISCKTNNKEISLDKISVGKGLECNCSNGSIRGTVYGTLGDFTYKDCKTLNGDCNLPKNASGGAKTMSVSTSNGNIDISFISK